MRCRVISISVIALLSWCAGASAQWPWPEDFLEQPSKRLGEKFITEELGIALQQEELCMDCHDGSVLDNRDLWNPDRFGHRVGIVPSKPLPQGIPLSDGKLYCGSCHLPHGGLPGTREFVKKPYLRHENTNDVFCVACHQERASPGPQEQSRNHSFLKKANPDTATANPGAWTTIRSLGGKVGKEGATRCQSCHRSHGAPSKSSLIERVDRSQLCSVCHHDIKDDRVSFNHPLHDENKWKHEEMLPTVECLTCHQVHEAPVPGRLLREQGEGLCVRCHEKNRIAEGDRHRDPRIEDLAVLPSGGEGSMGTCGACHGTHRAQGRFLARLVSVREGLDPDSAFCAGCHDGGTRWAEKQIGLRFHSLGLWPEKERAVGIPPEDLVLLTSSGTLPDRAKGEEGSFLGCRSCHFMHTDPGGLDPEVRAKNLRRSPARGDLCLACHDDRKKILGTSHNLFDAGNREIRSRFEMEGDNPCSFCHVVHGVRTSSLSPSPFFPDESTDPESGACLDCHGPERKRAEKEIGTISHYIGPWPVESEVLKRLREPPEGLPLYRPGMADPSEETPLGGVACTTCHQLHDLPEQEALRKNYLRPAHLSDHSCVLCHKERDALKASKHYVTDAKTLAELERRFGEIPTGKVCFLCHRIHNARAGGLWFTPLPAPTEAFGSDERTRRCLTCHLLEPFKKIEAHNGHLVGKPMPPRYDPPPEERLKLGRIDVGEGGERNVLVCATCHLNHGFVNPDGTVTLWAGRGLPDGDLCVACHVPNGAIVGSPHDFRTRAEGAFRPDDGRSGLFGVCGGCHANHGAPIEKGLLAFDVSAPRGQGNIHDAFCLHCHGDPRVMKDRGQIRFYVHPTGEKVRDKLEALIEKEETPVLEETFGEPGERTIEGYESIFSIHCRTCHDNHRWSSLPKEKAAEFEETEMTSFLKGSEVASSLCANCHGIEALYRYRLFHQERSFRLKITNE